MSGLFGALAWTAALPPNLPAKMAQSVASLPADVAGTWSDELVLLGARGLWHGPQQQAPRVPFVHPERGWVVVFDGRLDAADALAERLGAKISPWHHAALVAEAYAVFGPEAAAQLKGDFACALWDPAARRLWLARDVLGVRPLYYAQAAGVFVFASQPRSLFCHPGLVRKLDVERMAHYLELSFPDARHSFYRGVQRLEPAHWLCVGPGSAPRVMRYFQFDPSASCAMQRSGEYAAEFRRLFTQAVRERSQVERGLGCLLSGGLDSSGLYATQLDSESVRSLATYSARFCDFPEVDEGPWLSLLPRPKHVTHAEFRADRVSPFEDIDALHRATDEPFHAPNLFIYQGLVQLAQSQGTRVLLDGLDGDTVVDHGYGYLRELFFAGRPRRLGRALRALHRQMGFSYRTMLTQFLFAPERERVQVALRRRGLWSVGYLRRDLAHDSGFVHHTQSATRAPRTLRDLHLAALTHPILPYYLESYDKVAAAYGVDHRHPYFDASLMAFCLSLPGEQRLSLGWDRVVQRRAFEGLIPEPIRLRQSKSVWTPNFERNLLRDPSPRIRELMESEQSPLRDYCDLARLRQDWRQMRAGHNLTRLTGAWCALSLGAWLQTSPERTIGS